ncbi:MAG: hypothetical protein AB7O43_00150 [Hyphomicrobiaceae bacterium]
MSTFTRALWHVNRTQLGWAVKAGVSTWHMRSKLERRRIAQSLPVTSDQRQKAADLDRDGYAIVTDLMNETLAGDMAVAAQQRLDDIERLAGQQASSHKKFWVRLLDSEMKDGKLAADSIFVRYALQPAVINMLSATLGEVPWLDYVLLSHSRHAEGDLGFSQLWHRDHDNKRVIKLFTYLTDVLDDGDGPFTFLPKQPSEAFGHPIRGSHFPDQRVFAKVAESEIKVVKAPKLAAFMVETTRCLHMGSRMKPGHGRLLYTATYYAFPPVFPNGWRRPFYPASETTPLEKMVMGL